MKYAVGQTHERWTPFLVEDKDLSGMDEDGWWKRTIRSWRPGIRWEQTSQDESDPVWDGEGVELRYIVAVARIDGGGVRLLYRRSWRRPDGGTFGKPTVRMTTPSAFSAWLRHSNSSLRGIVPKRNAA